jgi:D-arabinose 1-dehydrogenase-like Zn-dependent alcohol dehydrogenase
MKSQAIVEYGQPLQEMNTDLPEPSGTEVLVKVRFCGVCHSDVHLQDGHFDLGEDKKLDISGAHSLPFVLGHEIEGEVVAFGPNASGATIGQRVVVFPWFGCGTCRSCKSGNGHVCMEPNAPGININGGYAEHVLVPNPQFLLDSEGIEEGLAGTYMCSGLTAFSALKKVAPLGAGQTIAIVGLGGVGYMGLQFARALFPEARIIGVDINDDTLKSASENGADMVFNSSDPAAAKQIIKESGGGIEASIDFVGAESSLNFAQRIVGKGGKVVVVGLFGGRFSMPIPMFPFRELSIIGSYAGSLPHAIEMLDLVRQGLVVPIPIEKRPLAQAENTLGDLRQGKIVGRVVLECNG